MSASNQRVVVVDYLRGIAALAVTWYHCTNSHQDNWVGQSSFYGWLGVEIFFVISGFAITYALQRGERESGMRAYAEFMLRRLIRLEPPYLLSVVLAVIVYYTSAALPGFRGTPPHVTVPQVLFHLAYLIPFTHYDWLQPTYWTLTYEFFFYLVGGALIPLLARRYGTALLCGCTVLIVALVLLQIAPVLILLFVIGIAACRLRTGRESGWIAWPIMLGCAGAMAWIGDGLQAGVGLGTAILIVAPLPLASISAPIARVLGGLGAISYSLYLLHVLIGGRIVNLGARFVHAPLTEFLVALLGAAASIAAAALYWRLVERPAMRAAHRFRLRGAPARPAAKPS